MHKGIRILIASLLALPAFVIKPAWGAVDERPTGGSLQFGIYQYNNLTTFGGTTISYQWFLSKSIAMRIGSTIEIDYNSGDKSGEGTGDYSGHGEGEFEDWNNSFSLNCEWLVYRGSAVSLFYGGGPYIAYNTRQYEWLDIYFRDGGIGERRYREREKTIGAGLTGTIGVQWAPSDWCAIHAEYRVLAAYDAGDIDRHEEWTGLDQYYTLDETWNTEGFVLDSKGVRFGLSIYF